MLGFGVEEVIWGTWLLSFGIWMIGVGGNILGRSGIESAVEGLGFSRQRLTGTDDPSTHDTGLHDDGESWMDGAYET